ncbi:unnamed protein product [Ostreobium quekettii]|uniref:Uncharacterized protein n=1 Tax=Ostreobium quekettii TaxID=121088 RepID=A0A8S1ISW5_9CHLO|nr:unnamed protein product [Ostreobium quekettii]|eukprot:evm.model.scf_883.3 EVM.evm.TU.scf_883.3   scf_883:41573-47306(+)
MRRDDGAVEDVATATPAEDSGLDGITLFSGKKRGRRALELDRQNGKGVKRLDRGQHERVAASPPGDGGLVGPSEAPVAGAGVEPQAASSANSADLDAGWANRMGAESEGRGGEKRKRKEGERKEKEGKIDRKREGKAGQAGSSPGQGEGMNGGDGGEVDRANKRRKLDGGDEGGFSELGLAQWLADACGGLGMARPTEIQGGCIPAVLAGRDVIGVAQTGSGKTAAFALPVLQRLARDPFGVFALVLTPTRELAFQLAEQFKALGAGMSVRTSVVVGRMDVRTQLRELTSRPHVVVATPGRLKDLLESDPSLSVVFRNSRFLVLDEADRLLDPCFEAHLRDVLAVLPTDRQTLLFSATMSTALIRLQKAALKDAYIYEAYEGLKTVDSLKQQYVFVPAKVKDVYLTHLLTQLEDLKVRSAMIFVATCRGCHGLGLLLRQLGIPVACLHAEMAQRARLGALERFRCGRVAILVATDVASRGLDIPTVDLVVNYDLPQMARNYVHRVGRTARAGRGGWAVSLVTQYDVELVHRIEGLIEKRLTEYAMPEDSVLKLITRVYTAKKAALLQAAKEEVFEQGSGTTTYKKQARLRAAGRVGRI